MSQECEIHFLGEEDADRNTQQKYQEMIRAIISLILEIFDP